MTIYEIYFNNQILTVSEEQLENLAPERALGLVEIISSTVY